MVAPGSVAQASSLTLCPPGGTRERSNSAWPEGGRSTGSCGLQPGWPRRRNHTAVLSCRPDRPPLTVRRRRTGGRAPPTAPGSACRPRRGARSPLNPAQPATKFLAVRVDLGHGLLQATAGQRLLVLAG